MLTPTASHMNVREAAQAKSRTLSALATHVANIPQHGANILTTAEMDVASRPPQPPKDSAAELVQIFDTGVARLKASVADTDAAKLSEGIVGWAEAGLPLEPEGGRVAESGEAAEILHAQKRLPPS